MDFIKQIVSWTIENGGVWGVICILFGIGIVAIWRQRENDRKEFQAALSKAYEGRLQDAHDLLREAIKVMESQSKTNVATAAAMENRTRVTESLDRTASLLVEKIDRLSDEVYRSRGG